MVGHISVFVSAVMCSNVSNGDVIGMLVHSTAQTPLDSCISLFVSVFCRAQLVLLAARVADLAVIFLKTNSRQSCAYTKYQTRRDKPYHNIAHNLTCNMY
jgi:hypothetical protein